MEYAKNIIQKNFMKILKKVKMDILYIADVIMENLLKLKMEFNWIIDGLFHIILIWLQSIMHTLMLKFVIQSWQLNTYISIYIKTMTEQLLLLLILIICNLQLKLI